MDEQQPIVDPVKEAAKLPLSERVPHKHWKVREAAYRELADKFRISPDDSKIYADFLTTLGRIARDANAPAQLVGFDALSAYTDTASPSQVRRVATDVVKGIVEKGLSGRPSNRTKAIDAILMFIGADAGDFTVEAVVSVGFKHRTPKIIVACVECLTMAIDTYGTGAVPVQPIAAKLGPLLDHSQEAVRTAAKALVVMLHRWVGAAIKPVLKEAKEVIVKEMEKAFAENAKEGKPKPKKLTRSMQQRARRTEGVKDCDDEDDGFGEAEEEEEEEEVVLEIDLLEKLSKIKILIEEGVRKDWYTAVDSKKWSARKSALDAAVETIGEARLTPGPHQEIFSRMRRILAKDANVNVVASAAKLIKAMAGGLKKTFPPNTAKALTVDLFGRLKEKNRIIVDPVCAALDALHEKKCIKVVELLDEITTASSHKVPKARSELFAWLGRCLVSGISGADLKGAPLKCFGTLCVRASDDSAPEVRDAGLGGLAALQKVIGERNVAAYTEKLDKKRKEKVAAMVAKLPEPAKVARGQGNSGQSANTRSQSAAKKKPSSSPQAVPTSRKASSPAKRQKPKGNQLAPAGSDDEGEAKHSPEDALTAAVQRFPGFESENWSVKSFRTRAAAVGIIATALAEKEAFDDQDVSIILGLLHCEPGLSDSNFVAVKPKLELFGMVAEKCALPPPRKTLRPLVINALEKLGDIKSAKMTASILTSHVEATSPRFFFDIILQSSRETKNSRALIGMLKFASSIVEDFGVSASSESALASLAAETMTNPAPAAKNAAVALACKVANRIGSDKFQDLMKQRGAEDELLEGLEAELVKYSREPDPPTKKKRFTVPSFPQDGDNGGQAEALDPSRAAEEEEENNIPGEARHDNNETKTPEDDRTVGEPEPVSVAHEFAPGARILLELKNSNWKKRQEALEYVERVVEDARDCIKPNIGTEIISALRARLSDSNRNLATLAYTVVNRLMEAMGPGGLIHLKVLAPGVLGQGCLDIKKTVRDSAMKCLDGWFQTYGLSPLVPYIHLPFSSLNSGIRKEFLEWLVPRLQGEIGQFDAGQEDLSTLVDPCLICLRDRTAEVRHFADLTLEQVIRSVGVSTVDGKVSLLTKSVQLQLEPVLDKYRGAPGTERAQEAKAATKTTSSQTPRSSKQRPHSVALPRTPLHRRGLVVGGEASPSTGSRRPRPASVRVTPVASSGRPENIPVRDTSPILKPNNGHDLRAQRFANKRMYFQEELADSNPSNMPPLIREELQDLAGDLSECCSTELYAKLMAPPNRFRMHVEAIDMVRSQLEENPDSLLSVADVLLRWAACRIEDSKTPPTVLVKLAAFVSNMSEILISSEVKLGDYEASAILPPVIEKTGSTRETVRSAMHGALMSIYDIVDDEVLLILFSSCLRQPFNAKALAEISHEICRLLDKRCVAGAGIPPSVLPAIGRVAGGEDDTAGKAAADCLEKAHGYFGDDLWQLIGELNSEEAAFLDERLTNAMNGVRQDMKIPTEDTVLPVNAMKSSSKPGRTPGPGDIRNEDFRLSVAPAPPSGVLTSISDSLNVATAIKTRPQGGRNNVLETPVLPNRIFGASRDVDAREDAANDILLRLKSADRDLQLSGLASIFEDLKRDAYLLRSAVGAEILLQLVRCFGDTLERLDGLAALDDDPAVLKSFLKGVIRFAREPELLCRLDQTAVELLLRDALNAMIPQTVDGVADWDQVRRGVNLMIVKILESCDQNLLFTAMINLLLKNIRLMQRSGEDRVSALAKSSICIKSIAKVSKRGFQECRIDALLRDIHLFLMANPVRKDGTASAEDQTFAMRLLKTVVNAIIDEIGDGIRTKLDLIPQPEKSQLVHYVEMTLTGRDTSLDRMGPDASAEVSVREHAENDMHTRGNVRVQEALSRIDPLAGSEEELQKLRAVLISYPEVDINSHLANCTLEVQNYIATGLARFREEANKVYYRGTQQDEDRLHHFSMTEGGFSDVSSHTNSVSGTAGQVYLKRLHEIQLRYGLQSNPKIGPEIHSSPAVVEKENGAVETGPAGEDARGKASSLRERMARIRELQAAAKQ